MKEVEKKVITDFGYYKSAICIFDLVLTRNHEIGQPLKGSIEAPEERKGKTYKFFISVQ